QGSITIALEGLAEIVGSDRLANEFEVIDIAERKKQFRRRIEPGADAIESGGDVLAHAGPVGATACHLDFLGLREKAAVALGQSLHDAMIELALEQLDQRIDRARTVFLDPRPNRRRHRLDV